MICHDQPSQTTPVAFIPPASAVVLAVLFAANGATAPPPAAGLVAFVPLSASISVALTFVALVPTTTVSPATPDGTVGAMVVVDGLIVAGGIMVAFVVAGTAVGPVLFEAVELLPPTDPDSFPTPTQIQSQPHSFRRD